MLYMLYIRIRVGARRIETFTGVRRSGCSHFRTAKQQLLYYYYSTVVAMKKQPTTTTYVRDISIESHTNAHSHGGWHMLIVFLFFLPKSRFCPILYKGILKENCFCRCHGHGTHCYFNDDNRRPQKTKLHTSYSTRERMTARTMERVAA